MSKKRNNVKSPTVNKATSSWNSKVVLWISIVASVVTILTFGYALYSHFRDSALTVTINHHNWEMRVGQTDTLVPMLRPDNISYEYIWKSDNEQVAMVNSAGIVHGLSPGSTTVTLTIKTGNSSVSASCLYTVADTTVSTDSTLEHATCCSQVTQHSSTSPATPGALPSQAREKGSVQLGYAHYEGDIANNLPHGNGIMTFTQSHLIPGTVDCTALPGERVIGAFRDGKVNLGTWYRDDGNELVVKLGQKYNN